MQVFEALEEEKQLRIINAGMEVFAIHGFKHANTEEIARKAGISKGLLFYYFKNKQSFFQYLFTYCETITFQYLKQDSIAELDDFFDLLEFGAQQKFALVKQYPYCMEFMLQAWFSSQDGVVDGLNERISKILATNFQTWFSHIEMDRFKPDIDPMQVYKMLMWMMEGYLYENKLVRKPLEVDTLMNEFYRWKDMFKKMTYREEFL